MTTSLNNYTNRSVFFRLIPLIISSIFIIAGRHFVFPGPGGSQFDLEWMAALLLVVILPDIPALTGIVIGHWISALFLTTRFPDVSNSQMIWNLEIVNFIGIVISVIIAIRLKHRTRISPTLPIILLGLPCLIIVGFSILNLHDIYVLIFGAGTVIISILALAKSKYMKDRFWIFYLAWIIGYSVYICLIWMFDLDPNTIFLAREFFIKFCLVPYPVFLLQLVLGSQVWMGIGSGDFFSDSANN